MSLVRRVICRSRQLWDSSQRFVGPSKIPIPPMMTMTRRPHVVKLPRKSPDSHLSTDDPLWKVVHLNSSQLRILLGLCLKSFVFAGRFWFSSNEVSHLRVHLLSSVFKSPAANRAITALVVCESTLIRISTNFWRRLFSLANGAQISQPKRRQELAHRWWHCVWRFSCSRWLELQEIQTLSFVLTFWHHSAVFGLDCVLWSGFEWVSRHLHASASRTWWRTCVPAPCWLCTFEVCIFDYFRFSTLSSMIHHFWIWCCFAVVELSGLGSFPIRNIADFKDTAPASWVKRGGVIMPMREREAMWMCFRAHSDPDTSHSTAAVKIGVGMVNAVSGLLLVPSFVHSFIQQSTLLTHDFDLPCSEFLSGAKWKSGLSMHQQDYLVCPQQPWLDGIKTEDGTVRQFVATQVCVVSQSFF